MDKENKLGLSNDDISNIKMVMDDLVDVVVLFTGLNDVTEEDFSRLKTVLDYADFIVSGVVYANALDLCAGHEHEDDDGVE